jgi:low affinity Fe/Cu permease
VINKDMKYTIQQVGFFFTVSDGFRLAARRTSVVLGSAWAFAVAVLIILIWIGTGPAFRYSDTWQLIINTGQRS